jgi:glycosyltransferase involved in cell wall biosynthesis
MKLLLCHNHYQQAGGEDEVFAAESALLESFGHRVVRYTVHNERIADMGRARLATDTLWNRESHRHVRRLIRHERPDVVHFYNTFPLLSPAVYHAARNEGCPVVQSLHNYRLLCPNGLFYREGRICEDCLGKFVPWNGVLHKCHRNDRAATAVTTAMLVGHRLLGTWKRTVDIYVAGMTNFVREKFRAGGIPVDRLVLKPNFVFPDPGEGAGDGGYALFAGRLTPEKGLATLLEAWKRLPEGRSLTILGDGQMAPEVERAAACHPGIEWLGRKSLDETFALLQRAAFLICPSQWYEAMPRILVDSFAVGTPVLASDLGAMADVVHDGLEGLHFRAGDADHLAERASWLFDHPDERSKMRAAARAEYQDRFTAEKSHAILMDVYQRAMARWGR